MSTVPTGAYTPPGAALVALPGLLRARVERLIVAGAYDDAVAQLEAESAHEVAGDLLWSLGRVAPAQARYRRAAAWSKVARCCERLGDGAGEVEAVLRLLESVPGALEEGHWRALNRVVLRVSGVRGGVARLANALARTGALEVCVERLESRGHGALAARLLEHASAGQRAGDVSSMASALEGAGQLEAALRVWERAGRFEEVVRLLRGVGRLAEAVVVLERAGRWAEAGRCALELGQPARAARAFERAEQPARALEAWLAAGELYEAAQILVAMGRDGAALEHLRRIDAAHPSYALARALMRRLETDFEAAALRRAGASSRGGFAEARSMTTGARLAAASSGGLASSSGAASTMRWFDRGAESASVPGDLRSAELPAFDSHFEIVVAFEGVPPRYEVLGDLASGGLSHVYRARDRVLDRRVALKIMSADFSRHERSRDYFLREIRAIAALEHPNVVRVYDAGVYEQAPYVAMELVEGRSLEQMLAARGVLAEPLVRELGRQICAGLAHVHGRGIVHRDIKAANVLCSEQGRIKLIDFGLARSLEQNGAACYTRAVGTPYASAPEQILGLALDHRCDIYSLGVLLFELSTGLAPFGGPDPLYDHVHTAPPAPRSLNPALSPRLEAILLRALAKQPAERFASASEMARALLG